MAITKGGDVLARACDTMQGVVGNSLELADVLLPMVPAEMRPRLGDAPAIEGLLAGWLDAARAAWPDVAVAPAEFARFVAERVARAGLTDLRALRGTDLYVACACAVGNVRAIAALEARYFPAIAIAIRRMKIEIPNEEVEQELRIRLFVAAPGTRPRIDRYNGTGDLEAWLRVSATRVALRLARRRRPDAPNDNDRLFELAADDSGPELRHLRFTLQPLFRRAFAAAMAALDERQRTLLSHHYLDELSVDRIGAIYGVHRATAARWLVHARAQLLRGLRERVAHDYGTVEDVDSLLRYVKSHLEITLSRLLRAPRPE